MLLKKKFSCPEGVEPACRFCALGEASGKDILCSKMGPVSEDFCCRRFRYDPLKRVPKKMPKLPQFDPSDFTL